MSEQILDDASVWLARRDRGLQAGEQDAYLEWLYANPQHGRAVVQLERVWSSMNKLEQWRPVHSAVPNPDLLLPQRSRWVRPFLLSSGLAAAAALVLAFYVWQPLQSKPALGYRHAIVHPGPERQFLEDGSIVELNQGARFEVKFTATERRLRLLAGEAHFIVAHNAARPFFVDTDRVSVRAVGTAFSVSLAAAEVGVLVTEGKVQVLEQKPESSEAEAPSAMDATGLEPPSETIFLTAGQRVVVNVATEVLTAAAIQEVNPSEMDQALSWQAMRLEFVDLSLRDVAAEFNHYNRRKLVIADAATAQILVAGNFRADNVDGFVRLLDTGFGVAAFPHGNEIVLRKIR